MHYILKVTTDTWLLTASGEGGALIDADVVFNMAGFPVIPARRVKGLLKESFLEVLEIMGKDGAGQRVEALFGRQGEKSFEGKLVFENLKVCDAAWEGQDNNPNAGSAGIEAINIAPEQIQSYFTSEIQQTAIDENGTAKKHSLRNYRVIKPAISFAGRIVINKELSAEEEELLKLAVLQLRYAGTRRNRGFGKIRCTIEKLNGINPEKTDCAFSEADDVLNVSVKLLSPVVLADPVGEQNTVFTKKHISGSHLRGTLASVFMRNHNLDSGSAHQDSRFFDFFLSGQLGFGNLFIGNAQPIPLHIHYEKLTKRKPIVSVFNKADKVITKSIGGHGILEQNIIAKKSATTSFHFHNSRQNRAAGRSTENDTDSGIFYYESLNEGQVFNGRILGNKQLLKQLYEALPRVFEARMGRSRSAQYGSVEITISPGKLSGGQLKAQTGKNYLLILESPMILLDGNGVPRPETEELKNAFGKAVSGCSISVKNASTSRTEEEQFNSVWMAKTEKIAAYAAGSSFLVELTGDASVLPDALGEWQERGYGQFRMEEWNSGNSGNYEWGTAQSEPNEDSAAPEGLKAKIQNYYRREQTLLKVKDAALKELNASRAKDLKNHLIGRLERLFKTAGNEKEVNIWIGNVKDKTAGRSIEKAGLAEYPIERTGLAVTPKGIFKFNREVCGHDWLLQQVYWATYFRALRKKNSELKA